MKEPIRFGKYLLIERINVGGMAEVFKAKTFGIEGFEKLVAIKRILPSIAEDDEFIKMFIDEAKITVKLQHANIAQVYELGKIDDSYFIAMEFINGKDLKQLFEKNKKNSIPMSFAQACYIVSQMCSGLDYAHRKKDERGVDLKIIHRDVSPQNIRISYDGEVKVIDFGIAKAKNKSSKTEAGILKGKFGYMSPEQVRGQELDRRSDIFAIGIIFYELVTNARLFQGETDFSTLEKIRNVDIPSPKELNPNIPPELETIIMKSLAKDRNIRYEYAHDMHDDIQRFMILNNYMYSRSELANWMKDAYDADIQKDLKVLKEASNYSLNSAASEKPQVTNPGIKQSSGNIKPPISSNMSNAKIEAIDWDDDELETQIFDKNPSFVGKTPEQKPEQKNVNVQEKLLNTKNIPVKTTPPKTEEKKKTVLILILVTVLSLIIATGVILFFMQKTNTIVAVEQKFIINVDVSPKQNSKIYLNNQETKSNLIENIKFGVYKLKIVNKDYEVYEKELILAKDKLTKEQLHSGVIDISVELKPIVKELTKLKEFVLKSEPIDGLQVLFNNNVVSDKLPFSLKDIDAGTYELKIVKNGYKPFSQEIKITSDDLKKEKFELNIILEKGVEVPIKVITNDNISLYIDGVKIEGKSPFAINVTEGKHKFKITSDLFEPLLKDVDCVKDTIVDLKATQKYVNVTFESTPEGADIYLIDKNELKSALKNKTPTTEKIEFENLAKIVFEKDGFTAKTIDFQWNKQTTQNIKAKIDEIKKVEVKVEKTDNKTISTNNTTKTDTKTNNTKTDTTKTDTKTNNTKTDTTKTDTKTNNTKTDTKTVKKDEFGFLSIMSKPILDVKINGKNIGKKTPIIKHQLPTGTYKITLFGPNIEDTFSVTIEKDKVSPVIKKY